MTETATNRLTMKEAALYLGRSYSWIFANHRCIGLNGYRIGGRWYFDLEEIKIWESKLMSISTNSLHSSFQTHSKTGKVSIA